jgi:chitin disaccharide deacetylase
MTIGFKPSNAASKFRALKHLVVTADDFGLAVEVNAAVESAFQSGILSATSLMIGGAAASDAIARAANLPGLRVGLHLVLVDGRPTLPASRIPDLVDANGELRRDLGRLATELACRRPMREQLRAEITAQFAAFERTGLNLDHVNVHKHFHLHPSVADEIISVGQRFGMRAIRVPDEPHGILAQCELDTSLRAKALLRPWTALLTRRAKRAGLVFPDAVFGLAWSGQWNARRLSTLIQSLTAGFVEIYLHPAIRDDFAGHAAHYGYAQEYEALTAPDVAQALRHSGFQLGGYSDLLVQALA